MDIIRIKDLEVYANHGVLPEERILGQKFLISAVIYMDFSKAAVSGNLSANLLGLGNAATPLGIRAARRMALGAEGIASNELCRLVVLNTASVQLLPTTVAAVRAGCGAAAPFDILPAVWISSVLSVSVGLLTARLLERVVR